ncbi:LysO family transporter [Fervidobacterium thailandense]|uniref:LysO family transporter n=1 Tax=Fervidobacterium thailandense TaxID=1008305 RepID=UPI000A0192B8|nr:LysO family transporter [Fervidobacterium thailandense]
MIWYVLAVFFAGFFLGRFLNTKWIGKYKVILVLTFFLLFSLGLRIGSNDELFGKIDSIAIFGFIIALFGSAGSFLFAFLLEKISSGGFFNSWKDEKARRKIGPSEGE